MGFIETTVNNLLRDLSSSIRKFTAFVFLIFAIGVIAGQHSILRGDAFLMQMAYTIPLVLALASYLFMEIAIAFFVIFLIFLLIL
ncbi:MAG: hypothetical protein ABH863_00795 [Candidatus Micrarchaeota archaeon]